MTHQEKEELLEEAKRKYPIGTCFISAMKDSNHRSEVRNGSMYWWNNRESDIVVDTTSGASVYSCGRWAEITYSPAPKIINNYSIY